MGHYAVRNKSRIFRLFDEGKRPSDIDDTTVSRTTLYQYYAEWRRERGIKGKETGFAVKKYFRNSNQGEDDIKETNRLSEAGKVEGENTLHNTNDRKILDNFILDCYAIIDALKRPKQGSLFLPGSGKQRSLADILFSLKDRNTGKGAFLSNTEYLDVFTKWVEIAKKSRDIGEFYNISKNNGINLAAPGLE